MKRLSTKPISSHVALDLWRRSRPVLTIEFKDSLMYSYYSRRVSQIESPILVRGRTLDSAIKHIEPRDLYGIEG